MAKVMDKGKGKAKRVHHHQIVWVSTILKKQKPKTPEEVTITGYSEDVKVWKHYIDWLHKEVRSDETAKEIQAQAFGVFIDTLVKKDPEYAKHVTKLRREKRKKDRETRVAKKTAKEAVTTK